MLSLLCNLSMLSIEHVQEKKTKKWVPGFAPRGSLTIVLGSLHGPIVRFGDIAVSIPLRCIGSVGLFTA
jgi:hypothetical protein